MKNALATWIKTVSAVELVVLATTIGCEDGSVQVAREAAQRQAEQNLAMADLQREVAAETRRLVEDQAAARSQTLEIHQGLQAERARVAAGWNELEAERRQIARARRTESFLAAMLPASGGAVAAVLALAFAWLALFGLRRNDDSAEVASQLLIERLLEGDPLGAASLSQLPRASRPTKGPIAGLLRKDRPPPPTPEPPDPQET